MSKVGQLGKAVGSTLAANAVTLAASILFLGYFGRSLTKAEMAVFAFITTLSSWITLVSGLGLATLACREVPGLTLQGRHDEVCRLVTSAVVWRSAVGVAAGILLLILSPFLCWHLFHSHDYLWEFRLAAINAIIASLYTTLSLMQWALQRFHIRAVCDVVAGLGGRLLAFIGFLLMGFEGFLVGLALGGAAAAVIQFMSLRQELRGRPMPFSIAIRRGAAYTGADVMKNLLFNLDRPLVGFLLGSVALADFHIAKSIYGIIVGALQAVTAPVGAKISEVKLDGTESLQRYFRLSLSMLLLVFVPVSFAMMATGERMLVSLVGPAYATSAPVLMLYGVTLIVQAAHDMWNEAVLRLLPGQFMILQNAVISVATYGGYFVLLPWLGAQGIPLAAAAGWLAAAVTAACTLRRRVGLTCPPGVYLRPLVGGIATAGVIAAISRAGSSLGVLLAMLGVGSLMCLGSFLLLAPPEVRAMARRLLERFTRAKPMTSTDAAGPAQPEAVA